MSVLSGKNIVLGVTAGIAAYKSAFLVRLFVKSGANVKVVMTPSAKDFVTPLTLSTLSKNEVYSSFTNEEDENAVVHRDVNGVILQAGDSVVLIKDLKVKGSSMVAKQGTAVRNIRLDHENAEYIEGKVDSQQIVIITKYVKKT